MAISFVAKIITELAEARGARVELDREYRVAGRIFFSNGKVSYFLGSKMDINKYGASMIATDKAYTAEFLGKAGFAVPVGQTFFSDEHNIGLDIQRTKSDGLEYLKSIGTPAIMKPNNMSQGRLVTKINRLDNYDTIADGILCQNPVMLIQKFYPWRDYRFIVVNGAVMAAYERTPLTITGNGVMSVKELSEAKEEHLLEEGRRIKIDLKDPRIKSNLADRNLTHESIIPRGEILRLLDNANASSGGDISDITNGTHKSFKDIAVRATKELELAFAGVDILAKDITSPPTQNDHIILELNASPGLKHYYATREAEKERVREIYNKILDILEKDVSHGAS